jgi:hypothetical protein
MFLWKQNIALVQEEINGEMCEKYFTEHTIILPPNSVIVADSGTYHSQKKERLPT